MVVERLDMEQLVETNEVQRGYWDVSLLTPEESTFGGSLLITDRRLLFHARQDLSHRGKWLEIRHMHQRYNPQYPESLQGYVVGAGKTAHLSIPRRDLVQVELLRGFIDRSVRLTLVENRVLTIKNAGFNAKKIVGALS